MSQIPDPLKSNVGETITQSTTTIDEKGNRTTFHKTVTNMRQTWSQMSRRSKIFCYAYAFGAVLNLTVETYNGGKTSLLNYRKDVGLRNHTLKKNEWDAIKWGCNDDSFFRFWGSVFWPARVASNVVPFIVAKLNKADC